MPIEILMPALSPTMTEGNIASWLKKEGDSVASGDVLCEIETDKATMEVEAVDEGTLGKIVVKSGAKNVAVNSVIALILEDGEDKKAIAKWKPPVVETQETEETVVEEVDESNTPTTASRQLSAVATKAPAAPARSSKAGEVKISPVAKRIAGTSGVSVNGLIGTGPGGRIVKSDVESAIASGGISRKVTRDDDEFITIENSSMRSVVAKRLLESKQQIPHFYLSVDCEIDRLLDIRAQINGNASVNEDGKPAYKLSVNDFVIKASALAMRDVPEANSSWYDDAIVQYSNVDISVAVAIDGGLITPIVKNADQKALPQISIEMKNLAARARKGELQPEEYQGGGFSISNLGMYGIKNFSAIINPPQACIMAVGAGLQQAVVKNGNLEIATVMTVTLSVDHRAVDGAVGANFLSSFKKYIQSPALLVV